MVPLITLGIVIGILVFITYPLFQKRVAEVFSESPQDDEAQELLHEKEITLAAIKELEFDYETGKLSERDYQELLKKYKGEALAVLEKIEKNKKEKTGKKKEESLEDQIEREIKAAREGKAKTKVSKGKKILYCSHCGQSYKPGDKFCPSCGAALTSSKKALICNNCGTEYQKGDKFCPNCGEKLK